MLTLSIDIGGTFTDITLADETTGELSIGKELTTAENPAKGALKGARKLLTDNNKDFSDVDTLIHGTTLVSNTLIEKTGAKTGLLSTQGTKDVLEIRRSFRYDIYDWQIEYPDPLVPRQRRLEVNERIGPDGEVIDDLEMDSVDTAAQNLVEKHEVDSIAVSLLHSYENEGHEARIGKYIESEYDSVEVTLSSDIAPRIREYERTSTTAINAYVKPTVQEHLNYFESELQSEGFEGDLYMMTSNSGIVDSETAKKRPVLLVESGPAAGVLGSRIYGANHEKQNVFSFDMGGTTAKGSIIEGGEIFTSDETDIAREHRFKEGSGYPVLTPMIDMTEIGAGGGSIASVSDVGLVTVGPESAGSEPGPVCYDLGGDQATVTDAALILGFLDPNNFFGGRMELNESAARQAIENQLADPLGISAPEAAWQVFEVVTENMANAFHKHASSQGVDPRSLSMVSIGGAGPMHAFGVAPKVGIDEIICPLGAGVGSSIGLTQAPKLYEATATKQEVLAALSQEEIVTQFQSLYDEAYAILEQANADLDALKTSLSLDMRHVDQGHEIEVPLPGYGIDEVNPDTAREHFEETYREKFNREPLEYPIEIMHYRVELSEADESAEIPRLDREKKSTGDSSTRSLYFGTHGEVEADIYQWSTLEPGQTFSGPAVVEANRTTTVADPNAEVRVSNNLDVIIDQS
jgi:N-methylhydantoinase A/oxoprolinase/acetone carboxylase beta subunit